MYFRINIWTLLALCSVGYTGAMSYCNSASGNALKIAQKASSYEGSRNWAYTSKRRTGMNTVKDYIFVAEVVEWAGGSVPHSSWFSWSPISTNAWTNSRNSDLKSDSCWSLVSGSSCYKAGDVIAGARHVGIVTGKGRVVHATRERVMKDGWGLRSGDRRIFWRYTC